MTTLVVLSATLRPYPAVTSLITRTVGMAPVSAVNLSKTKNIDSRADSRKRIFFRRKEYVGRYNRGKECGGEVARNGEESGY